ERAAWVPEALRGIVPAAEARRRWAALREFGRRHGHFLPTAGPYLLGRVTAEGVTLPVFRDFSYPLGLGSFDQYPIPLRAFIVRAERRGERLEIQAEVENIEKFERSYKIVREPFRPQPASEKFREPLTVHWVVLDANDEVAAAGASVSAWIIGYLSTSVAVGEAARGAPTWVLLALLPSGAIAAAGAGALLEPTLLRPFYKRAEEYQLLVTFGLLMIIDDVIRFLW